MYVVSAGVVLSCCGEVCQSGHGALEVVLLDTVEWCLVAVGVVPATGYYHAIRLRYCTRSAVMIMINMIILQQYQFSIYLQSIIFQLERC